MRRKREFILTVLGASLVLLLGQILPGCGGGGGGVGTTTNSSASSPPSSSSTPVSPVGAPLSAPTVITPGTDLPGVVPAISSVTSTNPKLDKAGNPVGTGIFEAPTVGSYLSVTFSVKDNSGNDLFKSLYLGEILVSGPTSNYQRVLVRQIDVYYGSPNVVSNGNGTYTYKFANPIPATYLPPYHNTMAADGKTFSAAYRSYTGDMEGQPLVDGTYTVGLIFSTLYSVNGVQMLDVGNITQDFTMSISGAPVTLQPHEEVLDANCNACHISFSRHKTDTPDISGGIYAPAGSCRLCHSTSNKICVLCHTAGAIFSDGELNPDGTLTNGPAVGANIYTNSTNESIDYKVMIHRLHDSANLPSVNNVGVNLDGSKNYNINGTGIGTPFNITDDAGNSLNIQFPVMPQGMTHRYGLDSTTGYDKLTAGQQTQEGNILNGVYKCDKCHKNAAQNALASPSRKACDSCHNDIVWTQPYNNMGVQMAAQADDSACATCHTSTGTGNNVGKGSAPVVDTVDAHTYPLNNSALNPGVDYAITAIQNQASANLTAAGAAFGDNLKLGFTLKNDSGTNLSPNALATSTVIVAGPTTNTQLLMPYSNPSVSPFDSNYSPTAVTPNTTPMGNVTTIYSGAFRKASNFTGAGAIYVSSIAPTVNKTLAIVFTASNTFDVVDFDGTTFTQLAAGVALPVHSNVTRTDDGVTYMVADNQGAASKNFAANDRYYLELMPAAATQTAYVPEDIKLELLGNATGAAQTFTTSRTPMYWGRQTVYEVDTTTIGGANGNTTLGSGVSALTHYLPVGSIAGFTNTSYIVIDKGVAGKEEYIQCGFVDNNTTGAGLILRLANPTRYAHSASATVQGFKFKAGTGSTTYKREGSTLAGESAGDYQVTLAVSGSRTDGTATNGQITLTAGDFTAGNPVLIDYRTYFKFPTVYAPPMNDSPDLGQSWGKWTGLPLLDGTYMVDLYGGVYIVTGTVANGNETTFRSMSNPTLTNFLFNGNGTNPNTITPRAIISSDANCNACHENLVFHGGGRRGFSTCIMCHSVASSEDRNKYVTNGDPETRGITVDFRTMLHKIHMGEDMPNAANYEVAVYNGNTSTFQTIRFPAMSDPPMSQQVKGCEVCHGTGNTAYTVPASRTHPAQNAATPTLIWTNVCLSCHQDNDTLGIIDDDALNGTTLSAAEAHVKLNMSSTGADLTFTGISGVEACNTCHGTGTSENVQLVHKVYK